MSVTPNEIRETFAAWRKRTAQLESAIKELVSAYESETGTCVEDITVERLGVMSFKDTSILSKITCRVRL